MFDSRKILQLANTEAGRILLGLKEKERIIKVTPNSVHFKFGKEFKGIFWGYDKVSKIFLPILTKMEIAKANSYKALLHYSDLERYNYPTIYLTTTDYYAGAGDGYVQNDPGVATWDTVRGASAGTAFDDSGEINGYIRVGIRHDAPGDSNWNMHRGFVPVDTSGLDNAATITAATLSLYGVNSEDEDNDGEDYITVTQSTQASNTALELGDFDQAGSTEGIDSGSRIDIGSWNASGYNAFTLNSTGRGWISLTGYTKFGLREGHDMLNHQLADNTRNTINAYQSEQTGTANDPYLAVTYTLPSGFFAIL